MPRRTRPAHDGAAPGGPGRIRRGAAGPLLILVGLATRFSALALLLMTLVIQRFVYPGAYATHATWAAVLLYLMARGPGALSMDHALAARRAPASRQAG